MSSSIRSMMAEYENVIRILYTNIELMMAETPDDFNLSNSVIAKLIKDALPEDVEVSKDARAALGKATSIFILYTTSCANSQAAQDDRETITAPDILSAVSGIGFGEFVPILKKSFELYKKEKTRKDNLRAKQRQEKANLNSPSHATSSQPTLDSSNEED